MYQCRPQVKEGMKEPVSVGTGRQHGNGNLGRSADVCAPRDLWVWVAVCASEKAEACNKIHRLQSSSDIQSLVGEHRGCSCS